MIVITILFYLWFLTSVVILVGRSIRRRRARRQRRDGLHVAVHHPPAFEPSPADAPRLQPTASPAPTVTAAPTAASPTSSNVATIARAAATPVTVAQVLAGIEMPCGLVPLTLSDHDVRYDRGQRAHFFTTLAPAEVVRTKLTEELERIGLAVSPLSDAAAVAKRGQLAVEMRISTVGALIDGVASAAFRSAPPNSVVVEFDAVPA